MSVSFTGRLKRNFAGNMSEVEQRICDYFLHFIQAALDGQINFRDAMSHLWEELRTLRAVDYDLESAVVLKRLGSSEFASPVASNQNHVSPELSLEERAFLEDAEGLIDWVTRNGVSFSVVLQILGHDLSELERDGFSLETTVVKRCVHPKVSGWASRNAEPVGEADEQM